MLHRERLQWQPRRCPSSCEQRFPSFVSLCPRGASANLITFTVKTTVCTFQEGSNNNGMTMGISLASF